MSERILGHIQVENDTIRISETKLPDADVLKFLSELPGLDVRELNPTDITWFAFAQNAEDQEKWDKVIAYASLERQEKDVCVLRWIVAHKYRNLGLGKLMARFATDQAIRYRQKKIVVDIDAKNEKVLAILESEDFEVSGSQGGITRLVKELKWQ